MNHLTEADSGLCRQNPTNNACNIEDASLEAPGPDSVDGTLWQTHMLAGDFEQAWQACDRIRARNAPDPHRFWMGEPISGKDVLVRSLHGLGDAVQMFRYAPQLNGLARSVTWQVPPHLVGLASCFIGVEHVITWEQPCAFEVQVEITELPYLFRTTLVELPAAVGYLQVPTQVVRKRRRRVALVWAASDWNRNRSVPLSAFDSILSTAGYDFISLQGGSSREMDPRLETRKGDLTEFASTMAGVDLVITVDTLAAHLAGALNVSAYVLLEHAADWRWMTGRSDSPWYPSLRLFRQESPGDWTAPLEAVHECLVTLRP